MKLSIIIPTHNRAESLKRTIESIVALRDEADFELVIVDNNSTDDTKKVAETYSHIASYVFEENTSFTKARSAGTENATGNIFLYLDDDVIVQQGSLKRIVAIFSQYPDCGVVAAKILPRYEEDPPDWALACEQSFNGWSLMNPNICPNLGTGFQDFGSACGPMMAIRRKPYFDVNGFPPDTVGVETNKQKNTFRKLYIGPGDYGLCHKIRKSGYKVYYSPEVSCYHVVSKTRFTVSFWRSRMIGEGHHKAITNRDFYKLSKLRLWEERQKASIYYNVWKDRLIKRLKSNEVYLLRTNFSGMLFEELWVNYYNSYLQMDNVLSKNPGLSSSLWEIGLNGVADSKFEQVISRFPIEFIDLIDQKNMYSDCPINSIDAYDLFDFPSADSIILSGVRQLIKIRNHVRR